MGLGSGLEGESSDGEVANDGPSDSALNDMVCVVGTALDGAAFEGDGGSEGGQVEVLLVLGGAAVLLPEEFQAGRRFLDVGDDVGEYVFPVLVDSIGLN